MLDIQPRKLISFKNCNDWNQFNENLSKYNFVDKYLGDKIKYWIEKLKYPLEVTILNHLFLDKLDYLEANLHNLENFIGQNNLEKICSEVEKKVLHSYQINQKFTSLASELIVYSELRKDYQQIKKINEFGDWIVSNKTVSVKTITDLDFNYKNIEDTIKGMSLIKEYEIIRRYNNIRISNAESLNYQALEAVLDFIRTEALKHLEQYSIVQIDNPEMGVQIEYNTERIKIYIDTYEQRGKRHISFTLSSLYDNNNDRESVNIDFSSDEIVFQNCFAVSYDLHGYFMEEKFNLEKISKRIQQILDKISNNINSFELWIVLSLHDKHVRFVTNETDKLVAEFKKRIQFKKFEVFLLIAPQFRFEMQKNMKLQLN